ncbi:cell envelope integrity protein CreD [Marilutibacter chinensis]|uniref:Cell envelope integrity protein CreD n=1 Tax=Marilutibacter chinensis TaxID=2912247 RepID=A0ABS9HZ59_9GAMM|nr:cell envelope integrity protein CreD [Lysobacter chinensis]MCF7223429.1 cell envelope integrity protein CreD [Lysobacter chinensis]
MRLWLKVLMVVGMTLAILVPLMMIRGVIHERQSYRSEAVSEVARSYAGAQAFSGPVLVVPYTETVRVEEQDAEGKVRQVEREQSRQWVFFPETLEVGGPLRPETRRLGLHEVRVYEWEARAQAHFQARIPVDEDGTGNRRIGQARLGYGIADVRGLLAPPRVQIDGKPMAIEDGLGDGSGAGVHVELPTPEPGEVLELDARLEFTLGGTESLSLVPLGKHNDFAIDSSWQHPRFSGSFLPRSRDIDGNGFSARWQVASVATNAQRQYLDGRRLPNVGLDPSDGTSHLYDTSGELDAVRVTLVEPVNVYSQADRATKYGLLFVLLTFVGFFIFELVKHLPIHPIQYGLVGLALAIFFLLLVSLSEHIAFGWAYLAASVACIGLLGFYLSAVLRSIGRGLGFATMLGLLYAALYGLLVSEDNALVLGSGLLFVVLAALMTVTRKVDWYQLAGRGSLQG